MSAVLRGMRNPFRDRARAGVVVVLLALVIGLLALLVQTAIAGRQQIAGMEARVCTLIKLREAGASGTAPELGAIRTALKGRTVPPVCAGF